MKIDLDKLQEYVDRKLVTTRLNAERDLYVYNYTAMCAYSQSWDEVTMLTRGLITDLDGNIIGRGFQKFFNADEHDLRNMPSLPWDKPYTITAKEDGSLFIVCNYKGRIVTATRGSFQSDQAVAARRLLTKKWLVFTPMPGKSYLFEYVAPDNRIVVPYGEPDIILLAVVDNETGIDDTDRMSQLYGAFTIPTEYKNVSAEDLMAELPNDGTVEGIVIRFSDGQRVKMKTERYKALHRILTGTNTITIWEYLAVDDIRKEWNDDAKWIGMQLMIDATQVSKMLESDDLFAKLLDNVPNEFFEFLTTTKSHLWSQFVEIEREALELYKPISMLESRKDKAIAANKLPAPYKSICMNMMAERPYRHMIWRGIRPKFGKAFVEDEI